MVIRKNSFHSYRAFQGLGGADGGAAVQLNIIQNKMWVSCFHFVDEDTSLLVTTSVG
jgi:hypothetical protein